MKTMFAITHVNADGMRTLTHANQGRNHHETREAAERALAAMLANNNRAVLVSVWGERGVNTFEVRPVECYDHGDAMKIYFD